MDDITHTVLAIVMLYGAYRWGRVAGELSNRSRALSTLLESLILLPSFTEEELEQELKDLADKDKDNEPED